MDRNGKLGLRLNCLIASLLLFSVTPVEGETAPVPQMPGQQMPGRQMPGAQRSSLPMPGKQMSSPQQQRQQAPFAQTTGSPMPGLQTRPSPRTAPQAPASQTSGPQMPFLAPHQDIFPIGQIDIDMMGPGRIKLARPLEKQLIPIGQGMNPIKLEASYTEPLSLCDTLNVLLRNNLPIQISHEVVEAEKWRYISALGRFLPDLENSYQDQYLRGAESIRGRLTLLLNNPFVQTSTGLRWHVFRGGSMLFGALQHKHLYRAARAEHHTTISDALLEASRRYYDLVLADVFLQIRIKAVETSIAQLTQNEELKARGNLTNLEVLQSKTQLQRDRQALIIQEVARRNAAIRLAEYLNTPTGTNFLLTDTDIRKIKLISDELSVPQLLQIAIDNRPELRFAEEQRLAAKRAIMVAASPLAPDVSLFGQIIGTGATLGHSYVNFPPGFAAAAISGTPVAANVLGGTQIPLPDVISGAKLVTPGPQSVLPAAIVRTPAQQVGTRIRGLFTAGFVANWNIAGLGVVDSAETQAAKAEARQAMLRFNDQLIKITEQVRTAYLNSLSAETQIDVTTAEVASALEELRFAQERLYNGVGTNVDVITAQRDYTNALVDKAQAIIAYDVAQIQLLHDLGIISVEKICSAKSIGPKDITPVSAKTRRRI